MMTHAWHWAKRQNTYVWSLALGVFGLIDLFAPGPSIDHIIGAAIAIVAGFVWIWQ